MLEVIDDAIDPQLVLAAWATWPRADDDRWHRYAGRDSIKLATRDRHGVTVAAWECLRAMRRLVTDTSAFPDWDCHGAGMHMIPPGGFLGRHLDSDTHPQRGWRREFSAVLCVNPDWPADAGGHFLMADRRVAPQFNRLILFRTTDESWHEVTRVTGPHPRCTVSLFFWSLRETAGRRPQAVFSSESAPHPASTPAI